jgi:hypothetical protein
MADLVLTAIYNQAQPEPVWNLEFMESGRQTQSLFSSSQLSAHTMNQSIVL